MRNITFEVRRLVAPLVGACALWLAGCGDGIETARVTGRVTWEGEPVAGGVVYSTPRSGPQAVGTIGEDGTFVLNSGGAASNVVLGKHRVYFGPPPAVAAGTGIDSMKGPAETVDDYPIPQKYRTPETSGLEFEVTSDGPNEWVIELP